jgi:hypothetical protein
MTTKREPYVFQIGFDFGTAYSKCVIRDLNTDDAFVYIPKYAFDDDMPFLFPSTVHFENGLFSTRQPKSNFLDSEESALKYLKLALEGIVNGRNRDILDKYQHCAESLELPTNQFVFLSTVFFLAKSISEITDYIKSKHDDFGKNDADMLAINMCIPVYCANEQKIKSIFSKALNYAWTISKELHKTEQISILELSQLTKRAINSCAEAEEYCYIYPEVSANMHGFIRSRASKPGTYLFSDTGAGTVDQCIFIFDKTDGIDKVAYISAEVFPLGSSMIERNSLNKFNLMQTNEKDEITSNLKNLICEIKSKYENIDNDKIDHIIKHIECKNHETSNTLKTKYILLFILQYIKENRDFFDTTDKKSSLRKSFTHFTNNKSISINTKSHKTDNKEINIIDKLLNLIIDTTIEIKADLSSKTNLNFKKSLKKIPTISNISLIFGGGGHTSIPYEQGVKYAFYSTDNKKLPSSLELPRPYDLDAEDHWMPRLSVAYGLSFNRFDLHKTFLPTDIKPLKLTYSNKYNKQMISKDDC